MTKEIKEEFLRKFWTACQEEGEQWYELKEDVSPQAILEWIEQKLANNTKRVKKETVEKLPNLWAEHRAEVSHAMEYGTEKDIPNFFEWVKTKL